MIAQLSKDEFTAEFERRKALQGERQQERQAKQKAVPPCSHLGSPNGKRHECPSCSGKVQVKEMSCAVHGACTVGRQIDGVKCCQGCPDRNKPLAKTAAPPTYFDRVVLINLKRRPDRLENFQRLRKEKGWPFQEPVIYDAIDGNKVGVPTYFVSGGGAFGCIRSHVNCLERAIMDGCKSVLVMEDDVCWVGDLAEKLAEFMGKVPKDWGQLMLGGQNMKSEPVSPGVVRCLNTQRTHAYAVRGDTLKSLLSLWYSANRHCDHVMGTWQKDHKVYAPFPFLFGQDATKSDIGREAHLRFWSGAPAGKTVVFLDASADVAQKLRAPQGPLHMGYNRDSEDLDKGLTNVKGSEGRMKKWLDIVLWEAATKDLIPCVWHPAIDVGFLRKAYTAGRVVEVRGTHEECLEQIAGLNDTSGDDVPELCS